MPSMTASGCPSGRRRGRRPPAPRATRRGPQVAGKARDQLARHEAAGVDGVAHEVLRALAAEHGVLDLDLRPAMRGLERVDEEREAEDAPDLLGAHERQRRAHVRLTVSCNSVPFCNPCRGAAPQSCAAVRALSIMRRRLLAVFVLVSSLRPVRLRRRQGDHRGIAGDACLGAAGTVAALSAAGRDGAAIAQPTGSRRARPTSRARRSPARR